MNKIMKIAAASLCLTLAITTLSACSSTENNKLSEESSKPVEDVTTTEESTEAPVQGPEETTEAPTTAEPATVESNEGGIIPFYNPSFENEIRNVDPLSLVHFDQFPNYFNITPLEGESFNGQQLYAYELGQNFLLKQQAAANDENTYNCRVLVSTDVPGVRDYDRVVTYWEFDGKPAMTFSLIPLFYNQDKCCIVGYVVTEDSFNLCEFYYYAPSGTICSQNVDDPSIYGF